MQEVDLVRGIQIPSNLIDELGVPQIIDITDELPKLRGGGWDSLESPRKLEALTDIVWHHTAEFVSDNCSAEIHANNHIRSGEGGCPYHIYIKGGQAFQTNDLRTFTYGVRSNNTYTVHAVVEGCYAPHKGRQPDLLSEEDLKAMIAVELTLRGLLPNYQNTRGHNYYVPTFCPGYSMTRFREEVEAVRLRLNFKESEKGQYERAYKIANLILYTYNLALGKDEYGNPVTDGTKAWARNKLLKLEKPFAELEFWTK